MLALKPTLLGTPQPLAGLQPLPPEVFWPSIPMKKAVPDAFIGPDYIVKEKKTTQASCCALHIKGASRQPMQAEPNLAACSTPLLAG